MKIRTQLLWCYKLKKNLWINNIL